MTDKDMKKCQLKVVCEFDESRKRTATNLQAGRAGVTKIQEVLHILDFWRQQNDK